MKIDGAIAVFVASVCLSLSGGCDGRKPMPASRETLSPVREAPQAQAVTEERQVKVLECQGTLHPANVFTLRLNANDIVESVHVKVGDSLKQGDLLVKLFNPVLQGEVVAARERILELRRDATQINALQWRKDAAAARLAELLRRFEAQESLRGKVAGYDPQTQDRELVDEKSRVEREIKGLENDIQQHTKMHEPVVELIKNLEQRIKELECRLSRLTVCAPHAGVIVRLERDPNPKDGLLLELHDRSQFVVRGALWQNQLGHVKPGSEVRITPDYSSAKQWKGHVTSVGLAPVISAAVSFPQYPLDVMLDEYGDAQMLRDGMTVMMRICPDKAENKP